MKSATTVDVEIDYIDSDTISIKVSHEPTGEELSRVCSVSDKAEMQDYLLNKIADEIDNHSHWLH